MGQPQRVNWRLCQLSEAEETKVVEKVQKMFEPFDFTADYE